jgi:outer membrane usher protein
VRVVLANAGATSASVDTIVDEQGDVFVAQLDELKRLNRVRWPLVPSNGGQVRLSDLGEARYNELTGEVVVTVRPELLLPQVLGTGGVQTVLPDSIPVGAAFINYDLRTQRLNDRTESGLFLNGAGYVGLTRVELAGAASSTQASRLYQARLVRENLEDSSLLEAGTVVGMAGTRGAPAALVGFGIRRDRGVTPGFITSPQLRFDGIASGRSTVDVLIDNQRISSGQVSAGPFSVVAQPIAEGGIAQVVVRDELGQERIVSAKLYGNPALLEVGQAEYGAWAGGLNTQNLQTTGGAGIGYYRRGLTSWLTAEASYEGAVATTIAPSISRFAVGADVATPVGDVALDLRGLGGIGQASLTYSGSRRVGEWTFNAAGQATRSDSGYYNVGGDLAQRYNYSGTLGVSGRGGSSYVTMAESPAGRLKLIGGSYRLDSLDATLTLSLSRFESGTRVSNSAFVGLSIPLGGGVSGSVSTRSTLDGLVKRVAINGAVASNVGGSLSAEGVHGVERVQADVTATMGPTQLLASVAQVEGQPMAARAYLRGGLVFHRGGASLVPPQYSDGGFALVDLGEPGVVVRSSYGASATTDASGYAVVPMPSLRNVKLSIDANTAPDALDLTPVAASTHRKGGFEFKRRAVRGQFLQVPEGSGALVLADTQYPVTDRGVWLELPAGEYDAQLNGKPLRIKVP